ncbi:hypothetical protein HK102_002951 [Quaeritorhiza haematococci]|nr:hypothetical protein HK102_002951 [Quaeritorhiza haematococci]
MRASTRCDTIVLGDASATDLGARWTRVEDMPIPRVMGDAVLLPDGTVMMLNGAQQGTSDGPAGYGFAHDPAFTPCQYHPAREGNKWQCLTATTISRLYHSTALLLPTGQISVAGSDQQNYANHDVDPFEYRMEVFTPPYLVSETGQERQRPIVSSVSRAGAELNVGDRLGYGEIFTVRVQRGAAQLVGLEILAVSDTPEVVELTVRTPPTSAIAPPGSWMLFVLSEDGMYRFGL